MSDENTKTTNTLTDEEVAGVSGGAFDQSGTCGQKIGTACAFCTNKHEGFSRRLNADIIGCNKYGQVVIKQ